MDFEDDMPGEVKGEAGCPSHYFCAAKPCMWGKGLVLRSWDHRGGVRYNTQSRFLLLVFFLARLKGGNGFLDSVLSRSLIRGPDKNLAACYLRLWFPPLPPPTSLHACSMAPQQVQNTEVCLGKVCEAFFAVCAGMFPCAYAFKWWHQCQEDALALHGCSRLWSRRFVHFYFILLYFRFCVAAEVW